MISQSYSSIIADAYSDFIPTQEQLNQLVQVGKDVLCYFPNLSGACAPMNATYAVRWQSGSNAPIFVVAGKLIIEGQQVFGSDIEESEIGTVLNESNSSWDGHCWLIFGSYIADISLFRTAYSNQSPPILSTQVKKQFGEGRGLLIADFRKLANQGFEYVPQYIFTEDQITGHFEGAKYLALNNYASQ